MDSLKYNNLQHEFYLSIENLSNVINELEKLENIEVSGGYLRNFNFQVKMIDAKVSEIKKLISEKIV